MRLIVRGDSGFSRPKVLRRLEAWGIDYVLGVQKNPTLEWNCALAALEVAERHRASGVKKRLIGEFSYAPRSWNRERRVIARLEHGALGADARFIVTSLASDATELYERLYCARGEAENRIKEAQLDLFGRRGSCHRYAAKQMRLLLAAVATPGMQSPRLDQARRGPRKAFNAKPRPRRCLSRLLAKDPG